jgi:polysaccharide export outer membrane protein
MRSIAGCLGLGLALALLAGCRNTPVLETPLSQTEQAAPEGRITSIASDNESGGQVRPVEFRLQVGDEVAIAVWKEPELTTQQRVSPDGTISPLLLGTVPVVGNTIDQARARLTTRYKEYLKTPVVSVRIVSIYSDRIFVLGEVKTPSAVPLVGPATVLQGVTEAGGFLEDTADRDAIRLIRRGPGGRALVSVVHGDLILAGRGCDVPLQRGDIIYVPARGVSEWSRTVGQALSPISSALDTAGSVAVIYDVVRHK